MSAKAIQEATGKNLLNKFLASDVTSKSKFAIVTLDTDWDSLMLDHPWLSTEVCIVITLH